MLKDFNKKIKKMEKKVFYIIYINNTYFIVYKLITIHISKQYGYSKIIFLKLIFFCLHIRIGY